MTSKINEIEINISSGLWVKTYDTDKLIIWQPKYFYMKLSSINTMTPFSSPYIKLYKHGEVIDKVEAFTGIVRELPIFYKIINNKLTIADVLDRLINDARNFNELSLQEFLVFGYVTSNRTLINGIFSLSAGESLIYENSVLNIYQSYIYNTTSYSEGNRDYFKQEFIKIAESIFDDLISNLHTKTVLLPLSAGYDSRFIASMLKMGGYDNVKCFAWGESKCNDIGISREIASKLGYEWTHVNYNDEIWKNVIESDWIEEVLFKSSSYVSTSGIASFPFQQFLRNSSIDFENCVILLGHTGDFICGGHIPLDLSMTTSMEKLVGMIINKHSIVDLNFSESIVTEELRNQLDTYNKYTDLYRTYEIWEWRERQAKFIVNTNRYYEFLNLDWYMPMWDVRFVKFWEKIPYEEKLGSVLYHDVLESTIFSKLKIDTHLKSKNRFRRNALKSRIKQYINKNAILYKLYQEVRKTNNLPLDEYGFYYSIEMLRKHVSISYPTEYNRIVEYYQRMDVKSFRKLADLSSSILGLLIHYSHG